MGGTWVHWNQAHVWHTMHRYGMTELSSSAPRDIGCQRFTVSVDGKKTELSRHDEVSDNLVLDYPIGTQGERGLISI
jgi:hypothetical protein